MAFYIEIEKTTSLRIIDECLETIQTLENQNRGHHTIYFEETKKNIGIIYERCGYFLATACFILLDLEVFAFR